MIDVTQLKKTFRHKKQPVIAVDNISFNASDGCITGLLGHNGAGKTTTLRMLYTLMKPDSGKISVDGIDVQTSPAAVRRRLGVLPDARGVYSRLTARENIRYFGQLYGMDAKHIANRIDYLVEALDMADIIDRRSEGFSQGQRTKTAIARAIVHNPKNIILDEPSNGLDVMTTRALRTFLRQLKAEGHCIIFSSHIMQEVTALCDHIIIVADGKVITEGNVDALRAQAGTDNLEDAFVSFSQGSERSESNGR